MFNVSPLPCHYSSRFNFKSLVCPSFFSAFDHQNTRETIMDTKHPENGADHDRNDAMAAKEKAELHEAERAEDTVATYATIMATNKPNPRGSGYLKLYLLSGMVFLCSTMNGFDSSLMGSINALPNYTEYFGLPANGNASTGIVFAIFQVRLRYLPAYVVETDPLFRSVKWPVRSLSG